MSSTDHDNAPSVALHLRLGFVGAGYIDFGVPGEGEVFFRKSLRETT